jgi:hypothetical protein
MGVLESFFKRERVEQKFLLANHVSQGRSVADAREAFYKLLLSDPMLYLSPEP